MTLPNIDQHIDEHRRQIAEILTTYLFKGFSISDILRMYEDLATPVENRNKSGIDPVFEYDEFGDRIIQVENINAELNGSQNIGIDLPLLFTAQEPLSTVMLVAMEPRRKNNRQQCTVASPFGLYRPSQSSSGSRIKTFVHQLLNSHYSVYVTDVSKVYALQGKHKYIGEPEVNKKIFEAELKLVKPSLVIAFGKSTSRLLSSFGAGTTPIIPLRHPAAWGGNKDYYEAFLEGMHASIDA